MSMLAIILMISSFYCPLIDTFGLKCDLVGRADYLVIGSHYLCLIKNQDIIAEKFNRVVDSVSVDHEKSKNNEDIQAINIVDSTLAYMPVGLDKFFNSLQAIIVKDSELKEIRKGDLKPFTKLLSLQLTGNQLKVIEPNLFEDNLNLKAIYLWGNRISYIDPKVFDNFIDKLRYLQLNDNFCQMGNSYDDIQESNKIIARIQTGNCKNEEKLLAFNFNSGDGDVQLETINNLMDQKVEKAIKNIEIILMKRIEKNDKKSRGKKYRRVNGEIDSSEKIIESGKDSKLENQMEATTVDFNLENGLQLKTTTEKAFDQEITDKVTEVEIESTTQEVLQNAKQKLEEKPESNAFEQNLDITGNLFGQKMNQLMEEYMNKTMMEQFNMLE